MKFSQFNSIIRIDDSHYILYNAYADRYVRVNGKLYSQINTNYVREKSEFDPVFYNSLIEANAIINDDIDEMALVRGLNNIAINNSSDYMLIVNPTTNCNFNCWYCYETHIKSSKMTEQTLLNVKKLINDIALKKDLKTFCISFFGGEPLLYFEKIVKPLMENVREVFQDCDIEHEYFFTTNGYLINNEMTDWFMEFEKISFQITLDGNREIHDKIRFPNSKKGSYDKIINNIKILLSQQHTVILRINYTKDNIDSITSIYDDIKDIPVSNREKLEIDMHRVWQDADGTDCLGDKIYNIMSFFKKNGFNARQQKLDNVRKPCYADKANGALINYNGDVFRCTARDFETFPRDGYLNNDGIIIWENNAYNKRINAKFQNEPCLNCRIMPLCCGACSQKALDAIKNGIPYCVNNFDAKNKDNIIIDRFYNTFIEDK